MRNRTLLLFTLAAVGAAAHAQAPAQRVGADRGISIRPTTVYITPDAGTEKVATMERGRELVIFETSRNWLHVLANVEGGPLGADENAPQGRNVSGWVEDRGIVHLKTPDAERILFGEAVDSEAQATQRRGRRGAAQDAMRLYARLAEFFPQSPLAGEAAYRAADIRWQIERAEAMSRPSARETDPTLRPDLDDRYLKEVEKKFPHTKWAELAAFDLIDKKICSDWSGGYKCPEREAEAYEQYFNDHPQSPKAAEALYNAGYRRAALIDIFKGNGDAKRSDESRKQAVNDLSRLASTFNNTDWGARGAALLFKVNQNVPVYGNAE
jgi:hypothetical protein